MNQPHDLNRTVDVPSTPADALDAGLAAGFGRPAESPSSVLAGLRQSLGDLRPPLLKEAQGESAHIVQPKSDAMPPPGQAGDRYQLQGEIARGGMGVVLRGRDVDLGRDLAVKVLLEKHADRPEVARRFIEEAQIGGQLQHPGVVPVYDIGRFGDRPYFTMKLVKGQTLAHLLAERADHTEERPRLLAIALQVAQTLGYAHAKGVIHRDLKPANVMVGAFGEVQVMDWGLAKVLHEGGVADEQRAASRERQPPEETTIRTVRSSGSAGSGSDTEAGWLLGTPAYMPPEQATGDVALLDRRADVFGLGAILCEILTGKPPYVGRSSEEVRRKAANGDVAAALTRLDGCGADAELILLTKACLSPEAVDRPRDAQAVAEGLTAYLDGVQQRLHQAELAEAEARAKAREEAKRRRLTLALAATVLVALTSGGGGWLYVRTEREARQATLTREVNDTLNKVTALRSQAKAAPVGRAALYVQAREQAQRALALVGSGPVDEALQTQVRQLQAELDEEEKDRRMVADLDAVRLAETHERDNDRAGERCVAGFRDAFRAYGLAMGEVDARVAAERIGQRPAAVRQAILASLDLWDGLANNPRLKIREPHREWLRAVLEAAELDDPWSKKVRAAGRESDAARRRAALEALARSAPVAELPVLALMRLAGRLRPAQGVELMRRAQRQYPDDFWVNEILGMVLQKVKPPRWEEAVRYLSIAVALRPDIPGVYLNLGLALKGKGDLDEAIACFNKALEIDPNHPATHGNLGLAFKDKGQVNKAIACFKKVLELDPRDTRAYDHLGDVLADQGRLDKAIDCYQKAIELNSRDTVAQNNLGNALATQGRLEEAIVCFKKVLALDPKFAPVHNNLGNALRRQGRLREAIACQKKALELDPKFAPAHAGLGIALQDQGHVFAAIVRYKKAIEPDPKYEPAHNSLGIALAGMGRLDEAIACYHKALELNPGDPKAHNNLGNALHDKGWFADAIACYHKALALDPGYVMAYSNLGATLLSMGQVDEAIASYNKAIALKPGYAPAHYNLGNALCQKRQYQEAVRCYEMCLQYDPGYPEAHCNLGHALKRLGRFTEAVAAFQRGHELGSKRPGWAYPSAQWLRQARQSAALQSKLPAFLKGDFRPADARECVALADVCQANKLYRGATKLYADAFAAEPRLADDLKMGHRYDAACRAALAAAGQDTDDARLDGREKARLRRQALDWLRADLALRTKQLMSGRPADRAEVLQSVGFWQYEGDLAGIRDAKQLDRLPADERRACERLWADVAELLKKAASPPRNGDRR
jgi:serine/threonine-protein kinase